MPVLEIATHYAPHFATLSPTRIGGVAMSIMKRGGVYQLRKRVPRRYQTVDVRNEVWISLHTDFPSVAKQKADAVWANQIEAWEAKLAGDTDDAEARFAAAQELARVRGFRYLPAAKVAALPLESILERVEAVDMRQPVNDAAALLGAVEEPPITVTKALELYWDLARDRTQGKSDDQLRRWRNPRKKAVRNFIEVCGDKVLREISSDDMLDLRQWWLEKIEREGLTANSGNKDLIHLGDVLKTVNKLKRLGLVLPLSDLSFKEGEKRTRPSFSTDWIRDKILPPGALTGLNTEARCILLGMVNTGYRPSEGSNLTAATIRLDADVPHISIEADGRQLKSSYGKRVIPLCGVSLEAFKECPKGFPRYRDKPGLSATLNSFLRENGLCETPGHTMYSLRHSFEDRMLAAGVDDRIRRDVFGHRLNRERYGAGASLEHLRDLLQAIAL